MWWTYSSKVAISEYFFDKLGKVYICYTTRRTHLAKINISELTNSLLKNTEYISDLT